MPMVFDLSSFSVSGSYLPFVYFWHFFITGGWFIMVLAFVAMGWEFRLLWLRRKYMDTVKFVLLAIDVPREIVPNLKAIEHIYSQFSGIYSSINFIEKYIHGKVQLTISLELVSIGGYIQFIVRTPEKYRDLVESAFYAQYPEAEITEVEDYTQGYPTKFPNDKYEVLGSGIAFERPSPYPIKTYEAFEHSLSQELADPMASLLEILSKLKEGEQIWIQMVLRPKFQKDWIKEATRIVNKMIGEKVSSSNLFGPISSIAKGTYETVTASLVEPLMEEKKQVNQPKNWMMQLTPREKSIVEAIQIKVSKKAYETKFRYIYLAEKDLVNKGIGISAMFGAFNQFASVDMNSFKPDKRTFTKSNFIFFNKFRYRNRQRKLMFTFKKRMPGKGIILNIEELASVFHFPTEKVKAPAVKKIETKRGEPPVGLPVEGVIRPLRPVTKVGSEPVAARPAPEIKPLLTQPRPTPAAPKHEPPPNLPFE